MLLVQHRSRCNLLRLEWANSGDRVVVWGSPKQHMHKLDFLYVTVVLSEF